MKLVVCVSARTNSRRLPGKALLKFPNGEEMIFYILNRLKNSNDISMISDLFLTTTDKESDDYLCNLALKKGFRVFRGSENNVSLRHLDLALSTKNDFIVRITGDCPFVGIEILEHCVSEFELNPGYDLYTTKGVFPVGLDLEIVRVSSLEKEIEFMTKEEEEHFTLRFYNEKERFKIFKFSKPFQLPLTNQLFTVDTIEDFEKVSKWISILGKDKYTVFQLVSVANS